MKKPIVILGVLLCTLSLLFTSCKPKDNATDDKVKPDTTEQHAVVEDTDTSFILLSQLAFKSYLYQRGSQIPEARKLYAKAQFDSRALALYLANITDTTKFSSKGVKVGSGSALKLNNALVASLSGRVVDVCLCPNSNSLCPCPGYTSTVLFATTADPVEVTDGEVPLKESKIKGRDGQNWKAFELTNLKDREFTLTVTANFSGTKQTYYIPMEIKDGLLYLDNAPTQTTEQ